MRFLIFCCAALGFVSSASAQQTGDAFFETKIRPVLVKHCYSCHSADSKKAKGGLKVDTRAGLLKGGDSGAAVVPKSIEKSLLYKAIAYRDKSMQMPPDGKLPDSVIADFKKWIEMGAPDPRGAKSGLAVQPKIDIPKGRQYWAYRAPTKPTVPAVRNAKWSLTDIDRFILASLEQNNLTPVKDADARTLVRRLHLTIIGLPPTMDAVELWATRLTSASTPKAKQEVVGKLVDELLASPRFGEHWGRHWMDVARFGESTGGDANNVTPHAWRYRDYVIDSFNADTPYDRFIVEQLAGDLLPAATPKEFASNIVATGFLATGVKLVAEEEGRRFFADMVDEQIATTTTVFLGTTVACARCHDHKFDPIPQTDYYAMAGVFRSTETHFGLLKAQARQANPLIDLTGMGLPVVGKPITKEQLAKLKEERDKAAALVGDIFRKRRAGEQIAQSVWLRSRTDRDRTQFAYQQYDEKGNPRVFAMGVQDRELPVETWLNVRGEPDKFGPKVPRGFVQVVAKPGKHTLPTTKGSGRLELAKWIANPENPLTARVMANRVWHHLFGSGLVRSVDDFGVTGEQPSHPELLDHLAMRFVEHKWSVKALIREIVLTRTWQLAGDFDQTNFATDPDNHYLWRMKPRRLTAEAIRDSMLLVSGNLDDKRPLGTFLVSVGEGTIGRSVFEPEIRKIEANCRSVYLPRVRNVLPEMLDLFDAPDASLVMGVRETTTSPLQGLYLMNSPFVRRQAEGLASRVLAAKSEDPIATAHLLVYGRLPTDKQRAIANDFVTNFKRAAMAEKLTDIDRRSLQAYCHALLCSAEFRILN
jgi:cytochrome c553